MFLKLIWIVPLLPLFGAAMMFFFGRRAPKIWVNAVCVGSVVLSFLWACLGVWQFVHSGAQLYEAKLFTWLGDGHGGLQFAIEGGRQISFNVDCGILLDPLSSIWLLFVTGIGMLIHIYSTGYMAHEGGYYRFFGYLNLFMFSMLTLILANNYVMMFVGWEGVGLCSYLLIGFYFHKHSASTAANKAFITNRIGDAGVILGTFTVLWLFGTVNFTSVTAMARANGHLLTANPETQFLLTMGTLALFVGACGKSAQFPLYVWLPDAMEGPTPVSALIHAATMVTAGVYMVARSNAIFVLAPKTMAVVAVVGAITAIFAASIGLVQNDIKRVLAYSTISQLGYMFLALGVGAFAAGVFHVFTHAFFKALLFLGAGSVIHAMSGEQDMRFMGSLRGKIPVTFATMLIGTLAIAGIPGLSGFFSKDEILWQTWSSHAGQFRVLWYVAYATAIMTSFYMFRLVYLTFFGQKRMSHEAEHHLHESPKSMTVPLVVLAVGSIFAGYLGFPSSLAKVVGIHAQTNRFEQFLEPVFANEHHPVLEAAAVSVEHEAAVIESVKAELPVKGEGSEHGSTEYLLMFMSVAAAIAGWFAASRAYGKAEKGYREPIEVVAPPVYRTLFNKYYIDEFNDYAFTGRKAIGPVRLGAQGLGNALWKVDSMGIDGAVNGTGWATRTAGSVSSLWDKWIVDGVGVHTVPAITYGAGFLVRLTQWGLAQWYALVMVFGMIGFVCYYMLR
jgi:NADH-quinone oxidoreductase subunit L